MLLNLISNGFYARPSARQRGRRRLRADAAAPRRKTSATSVEIRIRDNGTGIPAEVKEKMFNPFFTTKPAGEGTGLGLSMSHDIIVKQHGGTIDVETEPGEFTEFTIVAAQRAIFQSNREVAMSVLILVVDDEPDVEALFRQQFRRDLRAGASSWNLRFCAGRFGAHCRRDWAIADLDSLRHQHARHDRP